MVIVAALISEGDIGRGHYATGKAKRLPDVILGKVVPKLPQQAHKRTLIQDNLEIHYKYSGVFFYFCVATNNYSKRVCWKFIDEMETSFLQITSPTTSSINSMIKDKMNFFNDENNDQISRLKNKVDEVKDVMIDNIEKVIDRGEKIENLVQKTDDLENEAIQFNKGSRSLKNKMLARLIGMILLLVFVVLAIIVGILIIVALAVCNWPNMDDCSSIFE